LIFVDTSFWVALRNVRDDRHATAVELLDRHADGGLVTSNHVRGETWTFLRRRAGHAAAVGFLDDLARSPRVRILAATPDHEADALRWLRRHDERPYSFVDATSFALMRGLRIRSALTFDRDFEAAGFGPP
jgi:predicted nucleic acid-binding protein